MKNRFVSRSLRGHQWGSGALGRNLDPRTMRGHLRKLSSAPSSPRRTPLPRVREEASSSHHGEQAQRVVAPGRGVGHGLVPQVLELLLGLVKHLHALRVLVLQLTQLQGTREVRGWGWGSESREHWCKPTHPHGQKDTGTLPGAPAPRGLRPDARKPSRLSFSFMWNMLTDSDIA